MLQQRLTGVRVYFREWPAHESAFRCAFECLYPFFEDLFFVEEATSQFEFPLDNEALYDAFDRCAIAREARYRLFAAATLINYDAFVSDDWNGLALNDRGDIAGNARVFESLLLNRMESLDASGTRILFFHNFDGAFWQFFTNIDGVTDAMLATHRKSPGFDLRQVDISLHYPDPGCYRDDFPPPVR